VRPPLGGWYVICKVGCQPVGRNKPSSPAIVRTDALPSFVRECTCMNQPVIRSDQHTPLEDLVCLIREVGKISIWTPPCLSRAKHVARGVANQRRRKVIRELGVNLTRSLQRRFASGV
jgi:hypothetical protein